MSEVPPHEEPPDVQAARVRAGRAVRDLGHALVGHHAPVEVLEDVAATLEAAVERLSAGAPRSRQPESFHYTWADTPADGALMPSWGDRPVSGASSPWGVDPVVRRQGHEAVATVTLRSAHEGAPGRSHGGVVAAIFDDLMGYVLQIEQLVAYTGEITVRYEAPVPLHVPLTFRCRLRERSGRKLLIDAECTDGDRVLARSTAVFISPVAPAPH